jgi:glycosyltransferase A (GT-A) superfamily protein (DUF2064 family)
MPKDVLYVIDLQYDFLTASKAKVNALLTNCVKTINKHKKLNHKIVIVEYVDYGETHKKILKCIGDYENVKFIKKRMDNGSSNLKRHKVVGDNCYFIGVNLGACVQETCIGLYDKKRKLNIYKNSTKNMYDIDEKSDINYLQKYYKVNFI